MVRQLVCDDAPQLSRATDEMALCWIREGRHYAKLGARRRVRKRDVSFGPRTADGDRAWDTFQTLAATAQQLNVSFYHYVADRITGRHAMPALAAVIAARAPALNLGARTETAPSALTPDQERLLLGQDFAAGNVDREAWSALYYRYFWAQRPQMLQLSDAAGVSRSSINRRLAHGHQALARLLRERELVAERQVAVFPGAPARERIVVADVGPARAVAESAGALLAALRDEERVVALTSTQLQDIARQQPDDLHTYRLGRVAAWRQSRYHLDERSVALTVLLDQGEDATSGRWSAQEQRFNDLRDVLAEVEQPAIVLLGRPGSGKSTLLRRLELDTAIDALRSDSPKVTFFVQLNLYQPAGPGEPLPSPSAWLSETWRALYPGLPALEALLAEGRMILLLDALNEMPHGSEADYRDKIKRWKQFLHEDIVPLPGNRVVFSCRSLDYSAPLSTPTLRVPQVRLEPMSDDQVRRFLKVYSSAWAAEMWVQIEGTAQIELLRTPYFLRLLCEQAHTEREMARGQAGLFTGFVRQALRREIERGNAHFEPKVSRTGQWTTRRVG